MKTNDGPLITYAHICVPWFVDLLTNEFVEVVPMFRQTQVKQI